VAAGSDEAYFPLGRCCAGPVLDRVRANLRMWAMSPPSP